MIALTGGDYGSVESIIHNSESYSRIFLDSGLLGFKELYATEDQQQLILQSMGDWIGWFPNSSNTLKTHSYTESHSNSLERRAADSTEESSDNSVLLSWHIERVGSSNPQVAAAWNMQVFTCSRTSGKTLFYDCAELFRGMNDEDKEFLRKCRISGPTEDGLRKSNVLRNAVMTHPFTGEEVIRICPSTIEFQELVEFDSLAPSRESVKKFRILCDTVIDKIRNDESSRIEWEWSEGDLLLPDLLKMAHAVLGGFKSNERIFTGQWCYARIP